MLLLPILHPRPRLCLVKAVLRRQQAQNRLLLSTGVPLVRMQPAVHSCNVFWLCMLTVPPGSTPAPRAALNSLVFDHITFAAVAGDELTMHCGGASTTSSSLHSCRAGADVNALRDQLPRHLSPSSVSEASNGDQQALNAQPTPPAGAPQHEICFDFTKGLCTRGDRCKYSHDLDTIISHNSKEKGGYAWYAWLVNGALTRR